MENKTIITLTHENWLIAQTHLCAVDPVMAKLIRAYPGEILRSRGEPFVTLIRSIVGQQISVKAAESVWQRFLQKYPDPTPQKIKRAQVRGLRACGLSERKVEYIKGIAESFLKEELHVSRWPQMADEAIMTELVALKGIGRWTAEMFLLFNLLRSDIYPVDDIGLQKALAIYYFKNKRPSEKQMLKVAKKWAPYRSVATWYLWRALDPIPVEY